jgi:hypothetical protein
VPAAPDREEPEEQSATSDQTSSQILKVSEDGLGRESVRFLKPGSAKEIALSLKQPDTVGWFTDPAEPGEARYYNGTQWTGRLRKIGVALDVDGNSDVANLLPPEALRDLTRARATFESPSQDDPIFCEFDDRYVGWDGIYWHLWDGVSWGRLPASHTAQDLPFGDLTKMRGFPQEFEHTRKPLVAAYRAAVAAGYAHDYILQGLCLGETDVIRKAQGGWFRTILLKNWCDETLARLGSEGFFYGDSEVYGVIETIAEVLTTNGRAASWRRYVHGPELIILSDAIVFNGRQFNYDSLMTVSLTVDGELIASFRPTLTRMAALSFLPGTALIPGLALPKEKKTDERTAILAITHPDWQLAVQVDVDKLPVLRPIILRLEAQLAEVSRRADEADEELRSSRELQRNPSEPRPPSVVEELTKLSAMVTSGFLTEDEAAELKSDLLNRHRE